MAGTQIALTTVFLFSSFLTNASEERLTWKKHYAEAKRVAQDAKRPMVVVLENPDDPLEKLDDGRLSETDRLILQREHFELCRVDINTKYGKLVADAFGAKRFPYTAVTDEMSKKIVFRKAGQMTETDWTVALAKSRLGGGAEISQRVVANKVYVQPTDVSSPATAVSVQPQQVGPAPVFTDFGTPVQRPLIWTQPSFAPTYSPTATQCFT